MNESSLKLITSLEECCFREGVENSEYKFYYLLYILNQLDILDFPQTPSIAHFEPLKLSLPRYFSEYDEIKKLGKGSFGQVYLSRYFLDNNQYAVKKISIKNKSIYNLKKIINEIDIISKLEHPNIVRYYFSWAEPLLFINKITKNIIKKTTSLPQLGFSGEMNSLTHIPRKLILNNSQVGLSPIKDLRSVSSYNDVSSLSSSSDLESSNNYLSQLTKSNKALNSIEQQLFGYPSESILENKNKTDQVVVSSTYDSQLITLNDKIEIFRQNYQQTNGLSFIFYLQMEYCSQGSLDKYLISRSKVHYDDSLNILKQLVSGLKYLHQNSIIHRDLKPNNIFIKDQIIKIGDFGLAVLEEDNYELEDDEGCLLYNDPNNIKQKDKNNDIYALGVIIFELFYLFPTVMERYRVLPKLMPEVIDQYFEKLPKIGQLIKGCLNPCLEFRLNITQIDDFLNIK